MMNQRSSTRSAVCTLATAALVILAGTSGCAGAEDDNADAQASENDEGDDRGSTSAAQETEGGIGGDDTSSAGSEGECVPECGERACGPDPVCGAMCGTCPQGVSCDAAGTCVEVMPMCEANLFVDSFESADMSATNEDGFAWANNNRTSVVTMAPGPLAVWNNGPIENPGPDDADWTAMDGDHSLRFRYPAGEFWSEQRFDMGQPQPELWIRYWLRVPTNFKHGHSTPTNNKFFALWMDGYSQHGDGPTIVWNFWREGDTDNSRFTYSLAESGAASGGHHAAYPDFIRSPEDQGRWMQVVLYAKMSTDAESMDGESRIYRRWEGEDAFELIAETTGKNFSAPANGPNGWHAGYVMGWSNPAYDEDTEWLFDKFELSTEPLNCGR
jgi:hypothetical protein